MFAVLRYALLFEFLRNFHYAPVFGVAWFPADGARGPWAFVVRLVSGIAGPLSFVPFVGSLCIFEWGSRSGWWSSYHSGSEKLQSQEPIYLR